MALRQSSKAKPAVPAADPSPARALAQPGLIAGVPAVQYPPAQARPARVRLLRPRTVVAQVLLLGGGLQSSLEVDLILAGELERPDLIFFGDTHSEPPWVYHQVFNLQQRARAAGIPFLWRHLNCGGLANDTLLIGHGPRGSMPLFVKNADGSRGRLRRQCTSVYKIGPADVAIKLWLLEQGMLKLKPGLRVEMRDGQLYESRSIYPLYGTDGEDLRAVLPRMPSGIAVAQWFGYTSDEVIRAQRQKMVGWKLGRFPLLERNLSREDCEEWYRSRGRYIPQKSACIQCPYRDDESWLWMSLEWPHIFELACEFDDALRSDRVKRSRIYGYIRGRLFLHESLVPLREVDFAACIAARAERAKRPSRDSRRASRFELELVESCSTEGGFSCQS